MQSITNENLVKDQKIPNKVPRTRETNDFNVTSKEKTWQSVRYLRMYCIVSVRYVRSFMQIPSVWTAYVALTGCLSHLQQIPSSIRHCWLHSFPLNYWSLLFHSSRLVLGHFFASTRLHVGTMLLWTIYCIQNRLIQFSTFLLCFFSFFPFVFQLSYLRVVLLLLILRLWFQEKKTFLLHIWM